MPGRPFRFLSILAVLLSAIAAPVLARQFTFCTATNLSLGAITGGQIWNPGRGGYYWSGSAPWSFDCTTGNFNTGCKICGQADAYYWNVNTQSWTFSAGTGAMPSTGGQCASTGNSGTIVASYPATLKLATGAQYEIVMSIGPYNSTTMSCGPITLSSYTYFTGM